MSDPRQSGLGLRRCDNRTVHAVAVRFDLHVPASRSLKAKRAAIRPVVDGLRHRFKVSVAEVDHQDRGSGRRSASRSSTAAPRTSKR